MLKTEQFLKTETCIIARDNIAEIDCSEIEDLKITVYTYQGNKHEIYDLNALEFIMQTRPALLEGKRLKAAKFAWAIHNLIAHPLMQIFAFFKCYKLAFWIHDSTVPKKVKKKIK